MTRLLAILLALGLAQGCASTVPTVAGDQNTMTVAGVEGEDMLKLRAGPGIDQMVLAGLPNGTNVRVRDCTMVDTTRWCRVAMETAPTLEGYVSSAYLR
ncbi:Bacterial SH3 domain protein [Roseivivax jejudonensis]|uniref:Bacterial SH3 domain protein n=1 Tax=Roseivivax jejudonensis TaxID=1529041 RepID=A0A1X6ZX27_9RHOB|nr:SH3 domain-containing protein [Roseivivax jejudonensis]SLN63867.1 Bacterial SH3 domain protein [Roseivivax jejudonensis]